MFRVSQRLSSGDGIVLVHHLEWLVCVTVWYAGQEGTPDRHTKQSLTQTNHTKWCTNTIRSPYDERCEARNMWRHEINTWKSAPSWLFPRILQAISSRLYSCMPVGTAVTTHCSRSFGTSVHYRISKCKVVPRHDVQAYGGYGNRTPLILSLGIRWKPRPGGFTPPPTEQEAVWAPTNMYKLGKRNTVTYCNWLDHGDLIGSQRFQKLSSAKIAYEFLTLSELHDQPIVSI